MGWLAPVLGLVGTIIGSNASNHAANAAAGAAQQASTGESDLINKALLPIYNQMLGDYNKSYAPLLDPTSGLMQSLAGGNGLPALQQISQLIATNPQLRDALTGVPLSGITNELIGYDTNPGGTLSGLNGVGGMALSGFLDPNTALSGASGFAMPFYANEAMQGLDPSVYGSALNRYDTGVQSNINSIRNSLGAGLPNPGGAVEDLQRQALQGRSGLLTDLAAQDQTFRNQGVQGLLGTAGTLDEQFFRQLGLGLQTAGGIDALTQQMLNQAYGVANTQGVQGVGNFQQGFGNTQGVLGDLLNWIGQGRNILPGAASGIGQIANLYGNAATSAANNAYNLSANAPNPFSSLGNFLAANPINFGGGGGGTNTALPNFQSGVAGIFGGMGLPI